MISAMKVVMISTLLLAAAVDAKPLNELFGDLMKKHTEIKNQQLMQFISKAVPYGIDPPNPKIAEYETFKSDKSANFLRDGNGNVVFRQFRRLRLSDIALTISTTMESVKKNSNVSKKSCEQSFIYAQVHSHSDLCKYVHAYIQDNA